MLPSLGTDFILEVGKDKVIDTNFPEHVNQEDKPWVLLLLFPDKVYLQHDISVELLKELQQPKERLHYLNTSGVFIRLLQNINYLFNRN